LAQLRRASSSCGALINTWWRSATFHGSKDTLSRLSNIRHSICGASFEHYVNEGCGSESTL
jgi:hypothetical protein